MISTANLTQALIHIANTDGVDQAFSMLRDFAAKRQNPDIVHQVSKELERISSKQSQISETQVTNSSTPASDVANALNKFNSELAVENTSAKPDSLIGGLVIESGTNKLDLSIDKQLGRLINHLEKK